MTLSLLLASAEDGSQVMDAPLSPESLWRAPRPVPLSTPTHLSNMAAEPDSLPQQRWALLVPSGARGARIAANLAPLCELRSAQQGAVVDIHAVPPGLDSTRAHDFRDRVLHPRARPTREHPRYVLLAGSPEDLSLELQESLTGDGACFVGRLAFAEDEDYAAYSSKVVESEQSVAPTRKARVLFLSVDDGTTAVRVGQEYIVSVVGRRCGDARGRGYFPASALVQEKLRMGSANRLLELAGESEPTLLFSLSHGIGGSAQGWASPAEQRHVQGNLSLGAGQTLTASDIRQRPFLPGGIWFYFACFGAGTPVRSVYLPWMEQLVREGVVPPRELAALIRSRPVDGQPFMAALPQAALANPKGPLAVVAHMDLAWTHAFHDASTGRSHSHRLEAVLSSLVDGHRAGPALETLSRFARQADERLRKQYQAEAEAVSRGHPTSTDAMERALLWLERHDVTNYVLLGDPAARLVVPSPC
ncbi:hypothetical protein MXAN_7287 [Myxococcus xanthus DK 1622]|uniref:Gingipain domain-containing protein n=2 Tax=Myxococcus TaxID=32 RepID=Q1CW23_MYXXD|nr:MULTISPECIES: hypothetical protein [Myxococcus]ABF88949.1 hypothetical protein MXAN_7287 [Myxococcus xanthus DK 1622]NOJ51735.1 hypothetical protein [Myxococcus xanthus]QPM79537.1 hypothetical protein I5Q59_35845 [Myxococcus xanthus]QVW68617.1 hypothetical protein JTM82_03375 [Myxococcus xanthus DZ2]QZZ54887.1 hypothetical protein MyxoNM_37600 [Myxococcus xanthus]